MHLAELVEVRFALSVVNCIPKAPRGDFIPTEATGHMECPAANSSFQILKLATLSISRPSRHFRKRRSGLGGKVLLSQNATTFHHLVQNPRRLLVPTRLQNGGMG